MVGQGKKTKEGTQTKCTEVGASLLYLENSDYGVARGWAIGRVSVLVPEEALPAGGNIRVLCAVMGDVGILLRRQERVMKGFKARERKKIPEKIS